MNTTPYAEASDPCRLVKEPLVSVMMSTFNHEKYLGQAIESVLDQQRTFPIELIIAEDCSSDETRKIAFAYQKRAPESIRVLYSERNVGMHANGRRARFAARGKYGAWCEGDDFWHRQDKLSLQIPVLEENRDVILVSSSWRVVSAAGEVMTPDALNAKNFSKKYLSPADPFDDLFNDIAIRVVIMTLTACARLDAVRTVTRESPLCNPPRYRFADIPLWFELARRGRVCCLPEVLASYRHAPTSATRQPHRLFRYQFSASTHEFLSDLLDNYGGSPSDDPKKACVARARLANAAILGDRKTARDSLGRLRRLGAVPTPSDLARLCLAHVPLPRVLVAAAGAPVMRAVRALTGTSAQITMTDGR